MSAQRPVCIVGTGAVAAALARALAAAGEPVLLWGRDAAAARAIADGAGAGAVASLEREVAAAAPRAVVIAVADPAIGDVADRVARALEGVDAALLHTSGAETGEAAMPSPACARMRRGSLHPLVAVTRRTRDFRGLPFAVEGDAAEDAGGIARALGGVVLDVPAGEKPAYHALATMVATGVVALVERAAVEMERRGGDADAMRGAYALLARSAAENAAGAPLAEVLTGAVARGDDALVERHLAALAGSPAEGVYRAIVGEARALLGRDAGASPP